jgi:Na+-transporting methylmalonyl-CoA/oxaloacetate decarboxylase beta subunit
MERLLELWYSTGIMQITAGQAVMVCIGLLLL